MRQFPTPIETASSVLGDPSRLAAMRRYALLDTPPEQSFDRLTRMAAGLLRAPIALISLVNEERQFFKSQCGLPEPWAALRETPLTHSFCQHVVIGREPLVIEDARHHPLVHDNLAIRDFGVIAYLGIPLITAGGYELGSLCVIDTEPRSWRREEIALLIDLAASAVTEIELRSVLRELEQERGERAELFAHVAAPVTEQENRKRVERLRQGAQQAEQRLSAGEATLLDVAVHPSDVLWLTARLEELAVAAGR